MRGVRRAVMVQAMLTEEAIKAALKAVKYPGYSRDVVSFGLVKEVAIRGEDVVVVMAITTASPDVARQIKEEGERVLGVLPGGKGPQRAKSKSTSSGWPSAFTGTILNDMLPVDCGEKKYQVPCLSCELKQPMFVLLRSVEQPV